ncbi:MAG TPA: hypothetical protein VFK50_02490 [Sphingomicrobium sp.]|nr:hypothetical protein [Sphingomicrobium sp.]
MNFASLIALVPILLGFAGAQSVGQPTRVRTMTIEQQLIMRIPVRPFAMQRHIEWIERKGPKCIPVADIRGAALSGREHVDFILADRQRVRAELDDDCPALDFYGGFYLKPEDARLCAKRDFINNRIGGECEIQKFRRLEPKLRRPIP